MVYLIGLYIVFTIQLTICYNAKSRTARLMPAAICLLSGNLWLIAGLDAAADAIVGPFALISAFALYCAFGSGLALVVYGIKANVKKRKRSCTASEAPMEEANEFHSEDGSSVTKEKTKRKKILTIIQISYIVLVFSAVAITRYSLSKLLYGNILGTLLLTLLVVSNSMAVVFVIKSIVISVKRLIKTKQYFRLGTSVVLAISVALCVWNGLVLLLANWCSDHAIAITDDNREKIESYIEDDIDRFYLPEDIPTLDNVVKIKHISSFLDDDFKIYYEDGTTHLFSVDGCIYSLEEYIYDEGYNVYLAGPEYTRDCILVAVSLPIMIISAVVLAVSIKKKHIFNEPREYATEKPAAI